MARNKKTGAKGGPSAGPKNGASAPKATGTPAKDKGPVAAPAPVPAVASGPAPTPALEPAHAAPTPPHPPAKDPAVRVGAEATSQEGMALLRAMVAAWNRRDADSFSDHCAEGGRLVGFDGWTLDGRGAIKDGLGRVFEARQSRGMVAAARSVVLPATDLMVVGGLVAMVGAGGKAGPQGIFTMVALRKAGAWKALSFQMTGSSFQGRPELAQALAREIEAARTRNSLQ